MGNKVFAIDDCYYEDSTTGGSEYVKGECFDVEKRKWFEDSCKDDNTVIEYLCESGGCQKKEITCPLDYYSCSDGACKKKEYCVDLNDNYKDIYKQGTCEEYSSNGTERFIDTCADNKTLIEYYCTPGAKKCQSFTFDCSTIGGGTCNNGKCTKYPSYEGEQKCYDSDGGEKPNIAGWCRDYEGGGGNDSCTGGALTEYYCEEKLNRCIPERTNCPQGCDGPYKCAGTGAATALEPSKPTGANECCRLSHNLTDVDSVCSKDKVVGPTNPQWCDVNGDGTQDSVDNRTVKWGTCCLLDSIYTVSDWIFIMSFPLSILIFLVAGYFLLASGGDPQKVKNGKNLLTWGAIGLTIVILSKIIPAIIKAIVA